MGAIESPLNEGRKFFTISTAGHVDHGKTSLIRELTGIDPDRLKEEKERQMTTDLGFAHLRLGVDKTIGFIDVPGHGKFLKNMLAGVGGIDFALLVVAADEGIKPQTVQHVRILGLLGVAGSVVAITKSDLAGEECIRDLGLEIAELLKLHSLEVWGTAAVSVITGAGISELKACFEDATKRVPVRQKDGPLFLPVDRIFQKSGFGTVLAGTIIRGSLSVGDNVVLEPSGISGRVRRLETHGKQIERGSPGQRIACNLVLKSSGAPVRGNVVSHESHRPCRSLIAALYDRPSSLTDSLSERLSDCSLRLYHGTAEYHGHMRWVEDANAALEGAAGGQAGIGQNGIGQNGIGFVSLSQPGIISAQDKFVFRLANGAIYGGVVLLCERPNWLTKKEILLLSELLNARNFPAAIMSFIHKSPQMMQKKMQLLCIISETDLERTVNDMLVSGGLLALGEYLICREDKASLSDNLLDELKRQIQALETSEDGVSLNSLHKHLRPKIDRVAFQTLVEEEKNLGRLVRDGDKVHLPCVGMASTPTVQSTQLENKIMEILEEYVCLEIDEVAALSGIDLKQAKIVIRQLAKPGLLSVVGYDFVSSSKRIKSAHHILSAIWSEKHSITPTEFREKLGTTRKYAMALLQYFDDQKITRRFEGERVLLKPLD